MFEKMTRYLQSIPRKWQNSNIIWRRFYCWL